MKNRETIEAGESFERLLANADYQRLKRFIDGEIQNASSQLLQPPFVDKDGKQHGAKNMEDVARFQGELVGLATPESYMETIVKLMKKLKEKEAEEAKKEKEGKSA